MLRDGCVLGCFIRSDTTDELHNCTSRLTSLATNNYKAIFLVHASLALHLERLEPLNQLLVDGRISRS